MTEMTANQELANARFKYITRKCDVAGRATEDSSIPAGQIEEAKQRTLSLRYALIKRSIDIFSAFTLLMLVLPIFLVIALVIRFTSPGPIFYREKRMGRFGAPFTILKFRSMHTSEHMRETLKVHLSDDHLAHLRTHGKSDVDPRITPIGGVLRKWSLDELPQLINVMVGDMSLIGPRPIVKKEHDQYGESARFYDMVMPGISGLWQVSGRSDTSFAERVSLDSKYASTWNLWLDITILAKTIPAVLQKKGAY